MRRISLFLVEMILLLLRIMLKHRFQLDVIDIEIIDIQDKLSKINEESKSDDSLTDKFGLSFKHSKLKKRQRKLIEKIGYTTFKQKSLNINKLRKNSQFNIQVVNSPGYQIYQEKMT